MNNLNIELFSTFAKMTEKKLHNAMQKLLIKHYGQENLKITQDYILCKGNVPIMLVAHMDTVFKNPPENIYFDQKQQIMWSPQGLGADDRAGIFAIVKVLQKGYRPHICLTHGEEIGGIGAESLVKDYKNCPFDIKYIVELDRQGEDDCVFYRCDNEEFVKFVENYNFITAIGSFTDISILCPQWKIAGVNLSVGYLHEHSCLEILQFNVLNATVQKVCKMIKEISNAPYFNYIEDPYFDYLDYISYFYTNEKKNISFLNSNKEQCFHCGKTFNSNDVLPVISKNDSTKKHCYCIDCLSQKVNWCEKCGEPFEFDNENDRFCKNCR